MISNITPEQRHLSFETVINPRIRLYPERAGAIFGFLIGNTLIDSSAMVKRNNDEPQRAASNPGFGSDLFCVLSQALKGKRIENGYPISAVCKEYHSYIVGSSRYSSSGEEVCDSIMMRTVGLSANPMVCKMLASKVSYHDPESHSFTPLLRVLPIVLWYVSQCITFEEKVLAGFLLEDCSLTHASRLIQEATVALGVSLGIILNAKSDCNKNKITLHNDIIRFMQENNVDPTILHYVYNSYEEIKMVHEYESESYFRIPFASAFAFLFEPKLDKMTFQDMVIRFRNPYMKSAVGISSLAMMFYAAYHECPCIPDKFMTQVLSQNSTEDALFQGSNMCLIPVVLPLCYESE